MSQITNTLQRISATTKQQAQHLKNDFSTLQYKKISFRDTVKSQEKMTIISSFFLIVIGLYFFSVFHTDFAQMNSDRMTSTIGIIGFVLMTTLFAFKVYFFAFMVYNYFKYKSITSVSDDELPTCTIIVPAYNEGKQVWDTLMSLAQSNYPKNKLQLISIDDGSKDDTWEWMLDAKKILGDGLDIFQQPENKGKRHALYRGFKLGTGDIFVTVDSDSVVTENTLRNLVSPFVTNDDCGAVAGNIRVLNNKKEILPRMLDVSFVMSFEFVRSAESNLNSVLCTPGALAAYRRDAVYNCLEEWMNQTFMGQPSDIGEDRAMTNMILKQGKHVLFQKNAIAYTNVPEKYVGLYKMFIRWGRSNVRENIAMSKYVFTNFRQGSAYGSRLLFVSQSLRLLMSYPFIIAMLIFVLTHPFLFLGSTLVSILIFSTFAVAFYGHHYDKKEAFWAYSYSILYTFGLFWITPYAIATANRSGWLTRGLVEKR